MLKLHYLGFKYHFWVTQISRILCDIVLWEYFQRDYSKLDYLGHLCSLCLSTDGLNVNYSNIHLRCYLGLQKNTMGIRWVDDTPGWRCYQIVGLMYIDAFAYRYREGSILDIQGLCAQSQSSLLSKLPKYGSKMNIEVTQVSRILLDTVLFVYLEGKWSILDFYPICAQAQS